MLKKVIKSKDLANREGLGAKIKSGPKKSNVDILSEDGGVINKKVIDANDKASKIIEAANKEAVKIKADAEKLLEQVEVELEKARGKGLKDGREEGLASVTEMVVSFEKMKEEFYADAEEKMIKLVMTISEKIIGKIVNENSKVVKEIIKQALEKSLGERIQLSLNPEDYKQVVDTELDYRNMLDRTQRLSFKEDENIERGGCVVETEVGTIDARLETQLEAIRKALEL